MRGSGILSVIRVGVNSFLKSKNKFAERVTPGEENSRRRWTLLGHYDPKIMAEGTAV